METDRDEADEFVGEGQSRGDRRAEDACISKSITKLSLLLCNTIPTTIWHRICRNKRSSKTVMFSKGGVHKTDGFWLIMFSKGGVHETDGFRWVIFSKGGVHKTDGFWNVFLLLLKIKHPGRLCRQIRYTMFIVWCIFTFVALKDTLHVILKYKEKSLSCTM